MGLDGVKTTLDARKPGAKNARAISNSHSAEPTIRARAPPLGVTRGKPAPAPPRGALARMRQ